MKIKILVVALMSGALVLTACATLSAKPMVVIASPPSGSQYLEGDNVAVQSTSGDATGVVRVELNIDGSAVRNDTPPSPQTNFSIIQTWKATQGSHTITVRAYNAAGVSSDPAAISIQVNPSIALNNPSPTATTQSSAPPTPTNTPAPVPGVPSPTATTGAAPVPPCTNNAAFVADMSVPDGTPIAAGTPFVKTWRLSNNGTCAWGVGYQFVFISGEAMTGSTLVGVPATAPGGIADISVPMIAPAVGGNHAGSWRMRSAASAVFGPTVTVKISVPGAPPPPPPGCTGTPAIASFTASAPSVAEAVSITVATGTTVTLHWGAVTNADSVEIDHSIGGVPAPGSTNVTAGSPGSTTSYVMTAHCGGNTTTTHVTINVSAIILPPPVILYNFGGDWKINFGTMHIDQSGSTATGTYNNGTSTCAITGGTVTGATLDAFFNCGIFFVGNTVHITASDSNHFDGNLRTNKLCGARSGVTFTAGCGFAGHWNLNTGGSPETADLTQTGNTVAGTYGIGGTGKSIEGTVVGWTLTGTWHIGLSSSGPFVWEINPNDLTFKGHYGGSNWCGWRNGQPATPNTITDCHD